MKIASVCIAGRPAQQSRSTRHRLELLELITSTLIEHRGWSGLDAVVVPAGFLRTDDWFGPLSPKKRKLRFQGSEWGIAVQTAAARLDRRSPGCAIAVGIDTSRPNRYWRGDQMVVAFNESGPIAWARKIFPVSGDTDESWRCPILLFESDFADERRFLTLPSGRTAVLSVCYDGWVQLIAATHVAKVSAGVL